MPLCLPSRSGSVLLETTKMALLRGWAKCFSHICVVGKCLLSPVTILPWGFGSRDGGQPKERTILRE